MAVKVLGCVLIEIGAIMFAYSTVTQKKVRRYVLEEWSRILLFLKNRIEFSAAPLDEIFEEWKKMDSHYLLSFLEDVISGLQEEYSVNFYRVWIDGIHKQKKVWHLSGEELYHLTKLGNQLGDINKKGQIDQIECILLYLQRRIQALTQAEAPYQKFLYSISALSGLMIILAVL